MENEKPEPLWLEKKNTNNMGDKFRSLYENNFLMIAGAHDPMAALLARKVGFNAIYLSGAALTASLGLPDLGVLTMGELVDRTRAITRASGLPLVVDGDTGYGEAINVMRLIHELEDAGAAAIQLEDQILPKKCGHLNGKKLATPEDMAAKIAAARQARSHLVIIARTDAAASEGLDAAIERAKLYVEAGADVIFPEALPSPEDFRKFSEALSVPIFGNMTEFGRTPQMNSDEFIKLGVNMVIWPVSSMRIAAKAVENFYETLMQDGSAKAALPDMQTRAELYDTIRYFDYEALDSRIKKTVLPHVGDK